MAKSKVDFKDILLKKGEYIALGVAGVGLLVLLIWGVSTMAGAENPDSIAKGLTEQSAQVYSKISKGSADPEALPEWATAKAGDTAKPVLAKDFSLSGTMFDPIAKPDTKRENPNVLGIEDYQVDLVRAPMKGYDIIYDNTGGAKIAVKVTKQIGNQDKDTVKNALDNIRKRGNKGEIARNNLNRPQQPPMGPPMGPPGAGPGPGGAGPGGAGPGGAGTGGAGPAPPGGPMGGFGLGGGGFDGSAQRTEQFITYVPLDELDKAMEKNNIPAMTVIPLRLAVINATFPLKQQLEEVKRAMRLPNIQAAYQYVHFDGFDVRRRVSRMMPNGEMQEIQPWSDYPYLDKYIELIDARKTADHFDVVEGKEQTKYLPYFFRYEEGLVMPLPELVSELGSYPDIRIPSVLETIKKLISANTPKQTASDLEKRLRGQTGKKESLMPKTSGDTGAGDIMGKDKFNGPSGSGLKPPGGFNPKGNDPKGGNDPKANAPIEIDQLLIRFLDCDIKPGYTYEYQIRVRMDNPNFGNPNSMSNRALATEEKYRVLNGPWRQLQESLTVPNESFLYASDPAAYRKMVEEAYSGSSGRAMRDRLQAKPNQAVVEIQTWMEQVKMENSNKREPVGGWVVAEMPVGRGEYVGRKTYVKLPLWSSADTAYMLRELPDNTISKGKDQPKGWLVDFSTKSVLVDFEGGKVTTRTAAGRNIDEDVGTEMLIVRPDGKLVVRSSEADALDATRKAYNDIWTKWVSEVEKRKGTSGGGTSGEFDKKDPKN